MKTIKFLLAVLFSIVVAACGGGGGGAGGAGGTTADTTAPVIISTTPANGATGVAINTAIVVTFSEAMDPATVTASTFSIAGVSGTVAYTGTTATFTPASSLAYSTTYMATVTKGVKDAAGNALASNSSWTFTTGIAPDITPPTVTFTSPANSATGYALNSAITATFSEVIDSSTVTALTFTLRDGTSVAGTVEYSGTTATFTPTGNLAASTLYTATITTGVKDMAGNALASNHTWTFTTGTASDAIAPTVSSTSPANNAIGVGVNAAITATFSEPMLASAINTGTFTLTRNDTNSLVTGTVTYSGTTATFTPASILAYSKSYTAMIVADTTRKDLAGNALAVSYTWTFTTGSVPDLTVPTVSSTSPANNDSSVATNTAITATFSEPVSASTVNLGTFALTNNTTGLPVAGAVTYSGTTATFTPASVLADSNSYTATITTGVKDLAGIAMAASKSWSFTTGTTVDTTAPTVSSTSPASFAINATAQNPITASFSEALDASTVTTATFTLAQGISPTPLTPITGAVTYSGTTATFTPSVKLEYATEYTATISTQVKDLAGNALASSYSWSFTTRLAPVVNAVAAGYAHTVALKDDGTLWSWGYNATGQLGDGTYALRSVPTQVGTATDWAVMAAGDYHTLALKSDGTLWAWGYNTTGQLGDGSIISKNAPVSITNTTPSTTWTAIAGGNLHTLALKSNGTLWAWGDNTSGQLGDGTSGSGTWKKTPVQISGTTWKAIAGGANHSLALKSDGTLWAWGDNSFGQLGDGTSGLGTGKNAPVQIGTDTTWSAVSAGNTHSLAIKSDGTLWAWGENSFGQLGVGDQVHRNAPTQIGSATTWQRIDGGYAHTVAIQADKTLWRWGWNLDGGGNVLSGTYQLTPLQLGTDTNWSAISAGDAHSVALKTNWALYAWGGNASGQLGDGTKTDKTTPVQISY